MTIALVAINTVYTGPLVDVTWTLVAVPIYSAAVLWLLVVAGAAVYRRRTRSTQPLVSVAQWFLVSGGLVLAIAAAIITENAHAPWTGCALF